jgi:peptidoglycan/LPS O-acetylase OafA/YrhL
MPALLALVLAIDLFAILVSLFRSNEYLEQSLAATPSVLLYFSNWMIVGTGGPFLGWFGPLWSLSVEEQFYFVWPLVVIVAFRFKRPLRVLALTAIVVSLGANVLRFSVFDGSDMYRTFGTDFRVDMLLAGVLLAIGMQAGYSRLISAASRFALIPAVLYLVVVSVLVPEFGAPGTEEATRIYYTFGLPFVALSTVSIIGFLVTHQASRFTRMMSWRPLEYTGRISYGMYLWHYPILMALLGLHLDPSILFVVALAGTYGVATLSWLFVEQPLSRRFSERLKVVSTESTNSLGAVGRES